MTAHITHWTTDVWPFIDYEIHPTAEDAHRAALAKSTELGCEVAVVPLSQYDTSRKRGEG